MSDAPKRFQRKRVKGWRMPQKAAVFVGRGSLFGNPFTINPAQTRAQAVARYGRMVRGEGEEGRVMGLRRAAILEALPRLQGKDLVCWCPVCPAHADGKPLGVACDACAPCHADILLELANAPGETDA